MVFLIDIYVLPLDIIYRLGMLTFQRLKNIKNVFFKYKVNNYQPRHLYLRIGNQFFRLY